MSKSFKYFDFTTGRTLQSEAFESADFIATSAGAGDAGKPIKTDAGGKIDASFIDQTDVDHGSISGLGDDDHTQYHNDTRGDTRYYQKSEFVTTATAGSPVKLNASGKISDAQIPAIAITDTFVVASQVAMLALTAETGDVAIRSDLNKSFILQGADPTNLAHWKELLTPTDTVLSVNGQTGVVVLDSDDISEGSVNLYFTDERSQDAVGSIFADSSTIDFTYTDATPEITASVKADSINDTHIDFGTGTNQVSAVDLPIADAGSFFGTDNVEAALQQLAASQSAVATPEYTVGVGGVSKGDLVYISANNTVLKLSDLTTDVWGIGLAMSTAAEAASVKVMSSDVILTGVLSGATAGQEYYWTGSAFTANPADINGSQKNVYYVGYAKNATDLAVKVEYDHKN